MALWSHCAPAEAKLKLDSQMKSPTKLRLKLSLKATAQALVRSVVALVPAGALLLGACGDGQQEPNFGSKVHSNFSSKVDPNLVGLLAEGDTTSSLQNVTFGKSGECEPSVTPSGIPSKGSTLEKITITFCVTVSVPETGSTFVYDKAKWAAYLGTDKNNFYAGEGKITVDADNEKLGGSETIRNGKVTISLLMPGNKLPQTAIIRFLRRVATLLPAQRAINSILYCSIAIATRQLSTIIVF